LIHANKLFFAPVAGAFLILIPIIGVILYLLVILYWYKRNTGEIHRFFSGQNYQQHEASEDTLREFK